jgi:hypothetical protein
MNYGVFGGREIDCELFMGWLFLRISNRRCFFPGRWAWGVCIGVCVGDPRIGERVGTQPARPPIRGSAIWIRFYIKQL